MKINIFLDMDGVLAQYNSDVLKLMNNKGYFADLLPHRNLIGLAELLLRKSEYNVYILSSVIDSPYAVNEKNEWLDKYLLIANENRIYVPIDESKGEYVHTRVNTENAINVLIDDFSKNLHSWEFENALGIKVINHLNNTNKSWVENGGPSIHYKTSPSALLIEVEEIIKNFRESNNL